MRRKVLRFVKANYKESQIQKKIFISTLIPLTKIGGYNLFEMDNGKRVVVVFDDQPSLLNYINSNIGSVFALRFLVSDNNKYKYTAEVQDKGTIDVITLAKATVLIPYTEYGIKNVTTTPSGFIVVE